MTRTRAEVAVDVHRDGTISRRRLATLAVGACALALATACGKKADLKAPEGTVDKYPRKYPS
ncbi:MAG: hypothetical protein AAF220_06895 [Pseudomonadota bacterium]